MFRMRIVIALATAFVAVASTLGLATAQADENGCWALPVGANGTQASCYRELAFGEKLRAVVKCDGFFKDYYRYGPWISSNKDVSKIYCDKASTKALDHSYELGAPA
jgi:hypothetical protein